MGAVSLRYPASIPVLEGTRLMHPLLAEIIACKDAPRIDVLRRWQQQLRDEVAPLVDAGEAAREQAEMARLKRQAVRA